MHGRLASNSRDNSPGNVSQTVDGYENDGVLVVLCRRTCLLHYLGTQLGLAGEHGVRGADEDVAAL